MNAAEQLASTVGVQSACSALGVARASFYRQHPRFGPMERASQVQADALAAIQPAPSPRALSIAERETVLACLHSERFQDRSPAAVYATLLDEGVYYCSMSTIGARVESALTGCWKRKANRANAAIISPIRPIGSRNCWPLGPINFGAGTSGARVESASPSCWARPSGPTSIFWRKS